MVSWRGSEEVGCCAAIVSGPEKSRHIRQTGPTGGAETDRGITWVSLAFIEVTASNVGRELSGIGGGAGSGSNFGL